MSVRKSTLRASGGNSTGVNLLRNVGFWAFMLVGSFLIGFLIISPLINVASGSRGEVKSSGAAANNPSPAPQSASSSAPTSQSERRRDNESPVEISPDRSERTEGSGGVQEPSSLDQEEAHRRRSERSSSEEGPDRGGRDRSGVDFGSTPRDERNREVTGETQPSESTESTDRTGRTDSPTSLSGERTGTTEREPGESRRGSRRRNRPSTDDTGAGTRTVTPGDGGIQRGEGIDR
jgi:hypothetical protein